MNGKQLFKLLRYFGLSFAICYGVLYITAGAATVIFDDFLSSFFVITTIVVAMSVALFNFVDNTVKDLSDVRNDVDRSKLGFALDKLTALKREVLLNGGLVAFMFILERLVKGVSTYLIANIPAEQHLLVSDVSVSLRVAFLLISLVAASIQLKGFLFASGFREHILRNRK